MIEKRKNHFDVLPQGWVKIDHESGVPIYLHRPSRSVTISRPYCLGTASARVILKKKIYFFLCLDHTFPVHLFYQLYIQETGNLNITGLVQ